MSGRKYYCHCDSNCKFETMTKEQILAAITQAIETGEIGDVDTGFVTKIKETNAGGYVSFWVGTTAQYNALQTKEANCLYIITDETKAEDLANWANETFATQQSMAELSHDVAELSDEVGGKASKSHNHDSKYSMGMVCEFDSIDTLPMDFGATQYGYSGKKAKIYMVFVGADEYLSGCTFSIDRKFIENTSAESQAVFYGCWVQISSVEKIQLNVYLDDNGYPVFKIANTGGGYSIKRVVGYY